MRKPQSELLEAIKTLEDELFSVWNSLDKAVLMISEVNDEYFRKYDRDNKDDRIGIC